MCKGIFLAKHFGYVEAPLLTEDPTLQNSYNGFQSTQCHQDSCCDNSNRSTKQNWGTKHGYQGLRSKQMKQLMTPKHVTILSGTQTNCSESITNGFKQNKQWCHGPTWSARLKLTNKADTLTTHTQKGNSCLKSNTHSQRKPSLSSNCCTKWYQSKRVTPLLEKKQHAQPNNCGFSSSVRKCCPCRRLSISRLVQSNHCSIIVFHRSCRETTPFQMHTLKSLSIPKPTYRFTKSRKRTVSSLCPRMIQRMVHYQYQNCNCWSYSPNIQTKHCSNERQVLTNKRYTLPSFCCRSIKNRKIKIHQVLLHSPQPSAKLKC